MRIKIILGIIAIICGIGCFAVSGYITKQVAIGRGEIRSGQEKIKSGQNQVDTAQSGVNTTNKVIDNTTQLKGLGGLLTSPVQEKINDGKGQINAGKAKIKAGIAKAEYYENIAMSLKIAGIVLIIIGLLLFFFAFELGKKLFR